MGRPIKKSYFANLNSPYQNQASGGFTGIGGEGVASVGVSNSGTLYSQGATASFSLPNLPNSVLAVPALTIPSTGTNAGKIMGVGITTAGTGYTATPTLTITTASQVTQYVTNSGVTATFTMSVASVVGIAVGMRIYGGGNGGLVVSTDPVLNRVTSDAANASSWTNASNLKFWDQGSGFAKTVTLTSSRDNGIAVLARTVVGTPSTGIVGDIMKQESTARYLVDTADGVAICKLVTTSTLAVGEMTIIATDSNGSTYYVSKLTAHKAVLNRQATTSTYEYITGTPAHWSLASATVGTVTIANN